jgi:ATP-dependent Clp protease ATP-binding subunit ClpB
MTLRLTDAAKERLAEMGYDPVFGARPLKRVIQRNLQDALALAILEGNVHDGDHILVDADGDAFRFEVVVPQDVVT